MKKQLLNENEIRKMMKFANIGALSNTFVGRLNEDVEALEEETLEELDNEHTEGNSTPVIEMIATIIAILLIIPGWAVALLAIFAYFVRKSRKEN